jgi:hypothetical protein
MYEKTVELPPSKPRITGIAGLTERKLPVDATVLPKALLGWTAARDGRSAEFAPKVYALPLEGEGAGGKTLIADNQTQRDISSSRRRWRLAKHSATSTADRASGPSAMKAALTGSRETLAAKATSPTQTLLQPEDAWALSHILMLLKYPDSPLGVVVAHQHFQQRVEMFVQPGAIIRRMGYSLYGERYDRLEASLKRMAQLIVVEEVYDPRAKQWVAEASEPLLFSLDTGRCQVNKGVPAENKDIPARRHGEWRLAPGRPLIQMLNAAPSDLIVVPSILWKAAGRSRTLQYLALDASRFGFDNSAQMFPTQFKTLISRARLLDDDAHKHSFLQGELQIDPDKPQARQLKTDYREKARTAGRAMRNGVRHLDQSIARFSRRLGFADIRVDISAQTDLAPSQRKKGQRSLTDRVQFVRWNGRLENALRDLPTHLHAAFASVASECNQVLIALKAREPDNQQADSRLLHCIESVTKHVRQQGRHGIAMANRSLRYAARFCAIQSQLISVTFTPAHTPPSLLTP